MRPDQPLTNRLASIEILRGIAACAVIFSHVARHVDRHIAAPDLITLFQPGHAGVDLFFTLSGFIILSVHRSDIGRPSRFSHYLSRRLTRVMPLYWIALIATIGLDIAAQHPAPSAGSLLWWTALLPTTIEPLFAISWTLQYEAMFYVCFSILILDRRLGILAFSVWMIVIAAFLNTPWPPALCRVFGLEFLFGALAAQALHGLRIERPGLLAALGASAFMLAYILEAAGIMNGFGITARFAYGVPAAVTIVGLAASERAGRMVLPRWLEPLGTASYAIYLFQFIMIGTLWQALRIADLTNRLSAWTLFALLTAAALAGGIAVNRWIERPLTRAIRQLSTPRRAAEALVAP